MKSWKTFLAMTAVVGVAASASAQRHDCCSDAGAAGRLYNNATETTVAGTVDEVKTIAPPAGGLGGLHLVLTTKEMP